MSQPGLHLDFVGRNAVAFACHRWHYSKSVPASKLVGIGAWENGTFIGAIVFGRGASSEIASPFGLRQDEICELCRIALSAHEAPVSRILSVAIKLLRKQSPNLKAIISYSDPEHGHTGRGVYAASNWFFIGQTNRESLIRLNGRLYHPRTVTSRYGTRAIVWLQQHVAADAAHVRTMPKFRYILALDDETRRRLESRRLPYPKAVHFNATEAQVSGARGPQAGGLHPSTPAAADTTREGTLQRDPVAPLVHEAQPHV